MSEIIKNGRRVLKIEAETIANLAIGESFEGAARAILNCAGRVIVSGIGKSGLIARKIAATLASTGTPAFFLHPAEAYHGDLGMISRDDILLILSNSGESDEALKIVPFLQDQGNTIVAITGNEKSTLARAARFHIHANAPLEACALQLAPTSSTTAALALGDALAIAVMQERGFKEEHFARFHPGGSLGRKLLAKVRNDMIPLADLPAVSPETSALNSLHAISSGRLGTAIVLDNGDLLGIITDGDIRRAAESQGEKFFKMTAAELMTKNPSAISSEARLAEAEALMDSRGIHQLVALDANGKIAGLLPYRTAIKRK
ncbi:MAG: KpsF/GutQ family sugar-phosphate isomerase [Helicobacteraceae bacterium]|jgi:arabinose-5-phosphate isomerase|nr:KpsF/GutQ family sugar-phosphate isomerase [Helicobacteraceae bacterium]